MCSTPLIAFSSGAATVCSITSALAPGYTATTLTTGGAISGYCAIGSERIADRPAMTKKIDSTAAKIGRSMKKRENMGRAPRGLLGRRGGLGGPAGRGRRRLRELHRCAGEEDARHAVDDDVVAGGQALGDDPAVGELVADDD